MTSKEFNSKITYTKFTNTAKGGILSKQYQVVDDIIIKTPGANLFEGTAQRVVTTFEEFFTDLQNTESNQAFCYGILPDKYGEIVNVTVDRNLQTCKNAVARTKEYFQFSESPGIMLIDHDPDENGLNVSPDEMIKILAKIHPEFADVAYIVKPSLSSCVQKLGQKQAISSGFHIYVPVLNASDIHRYGNLLFDKLWLEGYGHVTFSRNGSMLVRSCLDKTVFSSERLDFVGKPVLVSSELLYSSNKSTLKVGDFLDTSTLQNLTENELNLLDIKINEAKKLSEYKSTIIKNDWKLSKIHELRNNGIDERKAISIIDQVLRTNSKKLFSDYTLYFSDSNLGQVTVDEVLTTPQKYNNKSLADPIEGKVYGLTTAKFYWNDGRSPCIHSFAHGEQIYYLYHDFTDDLFEREASGKIKSTLTNICIALSDFDYSGMHIAFDTFLDVLVYKVEGSSWINFSDEDYTTLRINLPKKGFNQISKDNMRDAVFLHGRKNKIDSAQIWLNALEWDGIERIDKFMTVYFGAEDCPYANAVSNYLWTALAGRILDPGSQADMVPILYGPQGCGKSTGIAAMAPTRNHFCEINLAEKDDDLSRKIRGTNIGELSELRGLKTKDHESIKSFITKTHEVWTPKFKEFTTQYARRIVLIGTTNEEQFLADSTGNRRYLPINVGDVNREKIIADCNQLWAEAAEAWRWEGIKWKDAESLAKERHGDYEIIEPWEETIANKIHLLDHKAGFTTNEVLHTCIEMDVQKINRSSTNKVSSIMRKLGYVSKQRRTGNNTKVYQWFKTVA